MLVWVSRILFAANVALASVRWRIGEPVAACAFLGVGLVFALCFEYEHWKVKRMLDAKAHIERDLKRIKQHLKRA